MANFIAFDSGSPSSPKAGEIDCHGTWHLDPGYAPTGPEPCHGTYNEQGGTDNGSFQGGLTVGSPGEWGDPTNTNNPIKISGRQGGFTYTVNMFLDYIRLADMTRHTLSTTGTVQVT